MKFEINISSAGHTATRIVELTQASGVWTISVDGAPSNADVSEIAPGVYSVLIDGCSHEVRLAPNAQGQLNLEVASREFFAEVQDPRAWRGRSHSAQAQGTQQIVAPMPGKVVQVLVKNGDNVEAGQGLFVVEAMKMQNEVRSSKSGVATGIAVVPGQPVNSGDVLCTIS